jgi:hypothetical protein
MVPFIYTFRSCSTMNLPTPSSELKKLIRTWVAIQKEKYGDDWKNKLAKELSADTMKQDFIKQFLNSYKK